MFRKSSERTNWEYKLESNSLQVSNKKGDLRVINNKLSREDHINEKVRNMQNLLSNLRRAFTYIDEDIVKKTITSFIRPPFEYTGTLVQR